MRGAQVEADFDVEGELQTRGRRKPPRHEGTSSPRGTASLKSCLKPETGGGREGVTPRKCRSRLSLSI